jgi:hypothetical protein
MSNVLRYVSQNFAGKGEMIFIDGTKYGGNFEVYLFTNGTLTGSIFLTRFSTDVNERFRNGQKFNLTGKLNDGLSFSAESCIMYSISSHSLTSDMSAYVARFSVQYAKVLDEHRLEDLETKRDDLHFEVGILNFYSRIELNSQFKLKNM